VLNSLSRKEATILRCKSNKKFYITRAHLSVWVDPILIVRIRRPNELNREGSAGSGMILGPCALRCAYFGFSLLPLAYSILIGSHRVATCRSAGTNLARVNASRHRLKHRARRDDFVALSRCGENTCHPSVRQVTILCPAGEGCGTHPHFTAIEKTKIYRASQRKCAHKNTTR